MLEQEEIQVTRGSDNIFEDLGFEPEEAADLKCRADLMLDLRAAIDDLIFKQKWSRGRVCDRFDIPKKVVKELENGEISNFSTEYLQKLLLRVRDVIDIKISNSPEIETIAAISPDRACVAEEVWRNWELVEVWLALCGSKVSGDRCLPHVLMLFGDRWGYWYVCDPADPDKLLFSGAACEEARQWLAAQNYQPAKGQHSREN